MAAERLVDKAIKFMKDLSVGRSAITERPWLSGAHLRLASSPWSAAEHASFSGEAR